MSNSKRSVYGFTMLGILIPGFVLMIKSLFEFDLFRTDHLWLPFLLITVVFIVLLYTIGINKSVESVKGQTVVMLIAALIYGFGSIRQINCVFDNSYPQIYKAVILDHRVSHGKSNSYFLTLSPWGPSIDAKEVEIDGSLFRSTSIGDTVKVNFKQGLLHIPWYVVRKD